jgi:hypothetical protein
MTHILIAIKTRSEVAAPLFLFLAFRQAKKSPVNVIDRASKNMAATYSPALWCSTIGHEGLNFSVRYGKR